MCYDLCMNNTMNQVPQIQVVTNPIEQVKPHSELSERYQFVSTEKLVDIFRQKGWSVDSEQVARARSAGKIGFQQHLIRMSHPAMPEIPGLTPDNACRPQIVVLNSHDGSKALRMFFGAVRAACANGLIAGTGLRAVRAKHVGDLTRNVVDGIEYLTENMGEFFNQLVTLQQSSLTDEQMAELVKTCFDARLAGVNNILSVNYNVRARRSADQADDAFTQMNRVQEILLRGGIRYTQERQEKNSNGDVIGTKIAHCGTRSLGSIPKQIEINQLVMDKTLELIAA